jgi:transposase-like protein
VDGTCEGDSPNLFCGLDGLSELVLDTVKIASEKKEYLVPFFRGIKEQYGEPRALVHDMGKGIVNAVAEVFPGTPDFICHFHFLRDIGKDLLLDDYSAFQKRLRRLKVRPTLRRQAKYLEQKINPDHHDIDGIIESLQSGGWQSSHFEHIPMILTYALIHWIFEYPKESSGYGFPFDRPYLDFYRRLQHVHQLLEQIMDIKLSESAHDNRPFCQLYKAVINIVEDKRLHDLAKDLEAKAEVFDKLRTAMCIALPEGKNGINDVQIDKYWKKLFADPIPVVTPIGILQVQPQRTNNLLERFFRDEKRRSRKKTGMASLNRVLKKALADTPLVRNLKNGEYVKIILNGCSTLAERFSQIDTHLVQQEMANAANSSEKILPAIKKMIRDVELTRKISALFRPLDAR